MKIKTNIIYCENFHNEIDATLKELDDDLRLICMPKICQNKIKREALIAELYGKKDQKNIVIIGCMNNHLNDPSFKVDCDYKQYSCSSHFQTTDFINPLLNNNFLVSVDWVNNWKDNLSFERNDLLRHFHENQIHKIILLDTISSEQTQNYLFELGEELQMPVASLHVGLDYFKMFVKNKISIAQKEVNIEHLKKSQNNSNQISAEYSMAIDLLKNLSQMKYEEDVIREILDLFTMLFSVQHTLYYPVIDKTIHPRIDHTYSKDKIKSLQHWLSQTSSQIIDSEDKNGFTIKLKHHDEVVGLLEIQGFILPQFKNRYKNLAINISSLCALAINNARLYKSIRDSELDAIYKKDASENLRMLLSELVRTRDLETILSKSLLSLFSVIHFRTASIYILNHEIYEYNIGFKNTPNNGFEVFKPKITKIPIEKFDIRKTVFSHGIHQDEELTLLPLKTFRKQIGFIAIDLNNTSNTPNNLEYVNSFTYELSIAIDNAKLFNEIEDIAQTDGLTNLFNHQHIIFLGNREFEKAKMSKTAYSVIMFDIDNFKTVNDTYGHLAGDIILSSVSSICKKIVRETDLVGRFGGDEFIILLPKANKEIAKKISNRIRIEIASKTFLSEINDKIKISVSMGVAEIELKNHRIFNDLLENADKALYKSKNNGKNQITVFNSNSF